MIHTRSSFAAAVFLLSATTLSAQVQQRLNIEQATVFLNGAELLSTAHLNLVKGENEITFTNVAGDVNSQSLTVNAGNGVVVESATFKNDYLSAEVLSPRAMALLDSIDADTTARQLVKNKLDAQWETMEIIKTNKKIGGDNTGLSVAELTKMLDLVSSRYDTYFEQRTREKKMLKKMDEHIAKLKSQLDEEQKKGFQPGGQLVVKFYAKEATASAITIDYIVPHAGWSPTYDITADDANSPIKLFYKANIHQTSGVSWNNVHLTLSTGNPNEGVQAPVMNPWYLAFYLPAQLNEDVAYDYKPQRAAKAMNAAGSRKSDNLYIVDGVTVQQTSMNEYVSVDNAGVNTTFDIDIPYTVPTDGQQHLVAIKKYELPATYRHYAVPKLDKDAFLQAQVTNWEDLNLLPGQTNIFYEGTYVGQGYMDVRNVKDTMNISLGRDKKIVVKRDRDIKLRSVKTIGTNVRETFAYTVTIRNTRKESVNLVVQDQLPVSNDKDIVIEDKETSGAEYDELTGMMKWPVSLKPNETKVITFGYSVKYPRGKTIENLR